MSLPPKLQRSLHNQLYARQILNARTEENSQELTLRKVNLTQYFSGILSYCKSHLGHIILLDVSFCLLDSSTIATICEHFYQLQTLHAKSCGLSDSLDNIKWPNKLQELDLSRNKLSSCPKGIFKLMYLRYINLSGNIISFIPTELLKLPNLMKCHFLNNPLINIPKDISREGVVKMRHFFSIEALPMLQSAPYEDKKCLNIGVLSHRIRTHSSSDPYPDLRKHLLRCRQSSFESDCDSYQSRGSVSSNDAYFSEYSDYDSQSSSSVETYDLPQLPMMMHLPTGYKKGHGNKLCQVYLPATSLEEIEVTIVKDLGMYPGLGENELLVTPVVRITPHGLKFGSEPAMIILPHCSKRNESKLAHFVPICSNTSISQAPDWVQLDSCSKCIVDDNHVLFSTSHFSFFAVIFILPYPSSSMKLRPHIGGTLLVPELPGFQLLIPNDSVSHLTEEVTITSTVHFCDKTYNASDIFAPASACIKLEPHGLQFNFPVEMTVPIPDLATVTQRFPDVKLELWTSQENSSCRADIPRSWELMNEADVLVEEFETNTCRYKLARFKISHFSWYEILYNICASSLQSLGFGASYVYSQLPSRARHVFVRYQAFISNPHDLTFGLLVAIFKFGDPLTGLSNYPLLVADSGSKRVALHVGHLHVQLTGRFSPSLGVGENLEKEGRIIDFTGEDFCERFEFALKVEPDVSLPFQTGQLLGQLRLVQPGRSISCNLMIPPIATNNTLTTGGISNTRNFPTFAEFTPPRSPEPTTSNYKELTQHYDDFQYNDDYSTSLGKRRRSPSRDDSTHSPSPSTSSAKRRILMSEDELTDRDLLSISTKCGAKYLELGLHLGLDYLTITNRVSRHEGKGEHLKAFEVLQEWKGRGFSFSVLAHALEKVGLHQLALRYCYNEVPG